MFKTAEKTELSQISLTGLRAIVLLGLLMIKPRSIDEIKKSFIEYNIMEENNSYDMIRIDINTLKHIGCEFNRPSKKTDYKYVLLKHPFALRLEDVEINMLKKVYSKAKEDSNLKVLIKYHEFFKKIAFHLCDNQTKEALLGISILRHYNIEMLKELEIDCKFQRTLFLEYKNPTKKDSNLKEFVAQKLFIKNDKLYLQGFDVEKNESSILNVKRILKILSRGLKKTTKEPKLTKIKFLLKDIETSYLEENEKIIETTENGYIVEGEYFNDFYAKQRILSLGFKCEVLEPIEFRNAIVQKLREMRNLYGE